MREIIVDNFAGGGGASTGIELAIGRSVDIAINHDENAIAMHKTNHPDTLHYCESVFDVDPVAATGDNPVGLAWFSPDCRHFSKAKGAKPVKKEIRGLAWVVVRWALAKRPRVMMLENVEEFKTWGPLLADEMRPDPSRTGETFAAFVGMLSDGIPADHPALAEVCEFLSIPSDGVQARALVNGLGYSIDYRELRACDFGAPTIRKRFFMVMRCDGEDIHWPEPTHGDPKSLEVQSGRLAPWRTAAECIDWSLPCQSIFERKKPLAENTLKRIARGIERFVLNNPTPFIVKCNHGTSGAHDCFRGQDIDSPLQTITKKHGYAVVTPFIAGNGGSEYQAKPRPLDKPTHTILKQSRACLVAPVITRQFGASIGHRADEPSATITAGGGGKSQLVTSTLIQMGYGEREGQPPRVLQLEKPLGTVTAGGNKFAAVSAFLAKHYGGNYSGPGPGAAMNEPTHTVTTTDHHAVVTSHLVHLRGTCKDGRKVDQPIPTVTAGGLHIGEVRAFLMKYYGNEKSGVSLDEPLGTVTTNDRFGLVTVDGANYQIVDIGMRMLQPHELYKAQGFPEGYIIDRDYRGQRYAKDKQVARCGNAVPPPFARALVEANLPELCNRQREVA
ncbi:DNA cytosine methyltransferase [Citrobacter sedlakii]|uniref:DNA cytosine methyltransferase n=1 Tax=Citrobacter TaxID=544 RepID=UPI001969CEB0|nr:MULTISPECIES: DNA cytosine methyltransferase [Citrobacter]MBM9567104.1 DNA cytosine methyltransferase [Citrobacter sedlakii]HBL4692631.1 DNA cytosine methyltransferase [Citrobacter sedlakii]HBL4707070.1 DNA cytosine methyltransferase [Citrobacter sedlakii]HBL4718448.1 DNA cytosine methyltransferase [Citrobacter sedlakii]HCA7839400.1 DNA cytosine methyltransferase [Citrobacter sedlakii]